MSRLRGERRVLCDRGTNRDRGPEKERETETETLSLV